jgi:hypothetical protein
LQFWLEPRIVEKLRGCARRRSAAARRPPPCGLVPHPKLDQLAVVPSPGVAIYDLKAEKNSEEFVDQVNAQCLAWHPVDPSVLCVGSEQGFQVWRQNAAGCELGEPRWISICTRPYASIHAVTYSKGGLYVAVGTGSGVAVFESDKLLDEIASSEPVHRSSRWFGGRCTALAWSHLDHIPCLAAAYEDNILRLWDTNGWEQVSYRVDWKGPPQLSWSCLTGHLMVCDGEEVYEFIFPNKDSRRQWCVPSDWKDAGPAVFVHHVPLLRPDDELVGSGGTKPKVTSMSLCPATGERFAVIFDDMPHVHIYEVVSLMDTRPSQMSLLGTIPEGAESVAFLKSKGKGARLALSCDSRIVVYPLSFMPKKQLGRK